MSGLLSFALVTFPGILFVVDPFAAVPMFLAMTEGDSLAKKRATATKAALAMTSTLLVFAAAGGVIFKFFGITLGAFQIAGGIIMLLMSLDMIQAQPSRVRSSPEEETEGAAKDDVAIIPLAIPILAGPGAIATVTVLMSQAAGSWPKLFVVAACILTTGFVAWILLRSAWIVERRLKATGRNILNRLMGLILTAVAVQFIVNGLHDVLPQITGH